MVSSGISFIKVNKNVSDGPRTEINRWINREMYDLPICIHSFYARVMIAHSVDVEELRL